MDLQFRIKVMEDLKNYYTQEIKEEKNSEKIEKYHNIIKRIDFLLLPLKREFDYIGKKSIIN